MQGDYNVSILIEHIHELYADESRDNMVTTNILIEA